MSSITAQCSECCNCPDAVMQWDSVSASASKGGACSVAVVDGVYYLTEMRCVGGRMRTRTVDPVTCIATDTFAADIRCCTNLFSNGGKRWASVTETRVYDFYSYSDTRPTAPSNSAEEDTVTETGTMILSSTVNASCGVMNSCSGSGTRREIRKGYFRELNSDPWTYDSLSDVSTTGTINACGSSTSVTTTTSFSGGFAEGNTEADAVTVVSDPVTLPITSIGLLSTPVTTVTYENEVAAAPAPAYSNPYTTEALVEKVLSSFPAFDNDWDDTAGSYAETSADESSYAARKARYRLRFPVPKVNTGKNYRAEWVERFVPEAGVGVSSVAVRSRGVYRPAVTLSAPPAGGTQARAVAVMSSTGTVSSIRVLNPGAGYVTAPTITVQAAISGGTSSTGWTATLTGGQVTAIGSGSAGNYRPTLSFSGGGGTGATATCTLDESGGIDAVTVTAAGSGYGTTLAVSISPKVSGSFAADLLVSAGTETTKTFNWGHTTLAGRWVTRAPVDAGSPLTSIEVVHGGSGFTTTPTVTILGGGGTGATAAATVTGGAISAITLTNPGSGYRTNPEIRLSYYGSETVLLAAHFGTETEYADGAQPPGAVPVGYVDGVPRTYPVLGDTGSIPWRYFEIPVPATDGTTTVANVRATCVPANPGRPLPLL